MTFSQYFKFLTLCYFLLFSVEMSSQNNSLGNWISYFGNQPIGKRLTLWNEIQYRDYKIAGDFNQLIFRAGLGYNLTENNNNILGGYAYIITDRTSGEVDNTFKEHRLWQQFMNRQIIGRVVFQNRYRLEERFIEDDFQLRFRHMVNVFVPLNNKTMAPKTFYTHVFNELFIKANSPKFDRNRLYGGLGYVVDASKRLELGILRQHLDASFRDQVQIYFFNNFRLK